MMIRNILFAMTAALAAHLFQNPHYFLQIPHVGFVFYGLLAGIPPFFNMDIWEEQNEWLKEGDVVLSVCAKCGTHWLGHMLHLIKENGTLQKEEEDIDSIFLIPERVLYPGQTIFERISALKHSKHRVFMTHAHPGNFKFNPKVKYVVGTRNLLDSVASLKDFLTNQNPTLRQVWGGFPPSFSGETFDKYFSIFFSQPFDEQYCEFYKNWWKHLSLPPSNRVNNLLLLYYSDTVKNPKDTVEKLAKFVNKSLTDEQIHLVLNLSSLNWMKNHPKRFQHCYEFNELRKRGFLVDEDKNSTSCTFLEGVLTKKGSERNGSQELSPELIKTIQHRFADKVKSQEIIDFVKR